MNLQIKTCVSHSVKLHIAGDVGVIEQICQTYCDAVGLCVTITPTKYVYKNGCEDGVTIGLINYPRFPTELSTLTKHAYTIGYRILEQTDQLSFTVEAPNGMVYYYKPEKENV